MILGVPEAVSFDPVRVLRDGLPPVPSTPLHPGERYPLALSSEDSIAVVMYVARGPDGSWWLETSDLQHDAQAGWHQIGSGRCNWVDVFSPPPELARSVCLPPSITWTAGDGGETWTIAGMCAAEVATVRTTDDTGDRGYPLSADRPFFVVRIRGATGIVRFLDRDGSDLVNSAGTSSQLRLDWRTGTR
jgi:hypothetical protein